MAVPNSSFSELASLTIESRSPTIADNFSVSTALLFRLREKGKIKFWTGGTTILQHLAYQENGTFTRFSGYDTVDISPSDVFTSANFSPKQASVAVTISKLEELQNSGKEQMFDLLEERIANAEQTLIQNIGLDMYSDGTGSGSKQIGGLSHLIPSDPTTGTVGGIDRATWTFWRPSLVDASVGIGGGAVTTSSTTIQSLMTYAVLNQTRNNESPDLMIGDNTYYSYYLASLQGNQRFTNAKLAEGGFENVRFMGCDVTFDGGVGGGLSSGSKLFYVLNTNYIHFRPHKNAYFVPAEADRYSVNQLAMVKLIHFAGNMTVSNSRLQGRIQE